MKLHLKYLTLAFAALALLGSCGDDDDNIVNPAKDGPKPQMNIAVAQADGLAYGDFINVSGTMTDERNLQRYTLLLRNSAGDTLAMKEQELLGQTFHMDDRLQIPLPKNATADNLKLAVILDNTRNGEVGQEFDIPSVTNPSFETLFLRLGNGQVVSLIKKGDVFTTPTEVLFPANVKGVISTENNGSGIWWGTRKGEIASMTRDSITIGRDVESSYTVTFNPVTFDLTLGEQHIWEPIKGQRSWYILGTISGHWMDGEITAEKQKMLMTGYQSGDQKYYTWTAPDGDDPEVGMWGSTAAGVFRLKLAGLPRYILWDGTKVITTTQDDKSKSFPLTMGGAFTIKANFDGDECTSVEVSGSGHSVTFANGMVIVNGMTVKPSTTFGNGSLSLKAGTSYVYEGKVNLSKGEMASSALGLASFIPNPDLFSGMGNSSWKVQGASGEYLIRLDAFSGEAYACPTGGYPDFLYLSGWSVGPTATSNPDVWDATKTIPLVNIGNNIFEATLYDFGWGGDFKLYKNFVGEGADPDPLLNSTFTGDHIESSTPDAFLLPGAAGLYTIRVDLSGAKGTITFTPKQ